MMDRLKVSSPACVPAGRTLVARGNATAKRTGFPPRPAAFPTIGRGRSPGLRDRAYRLPVSSHSQWPFGLIRPHTLTVAGAAEALAVPAAPLSRFTPARGTRRDTSNERVDCTAQVAGLCLAAASGIYIENESLHLDLTGFSKL